MQSKYEGKWLDNILQPTIAESKDLSANAAINLPSNVPQIISVLKFIKLLVNTNWSCLLTYSGDITLIELLWDIWCILYTPIYWSYITLFNCSGEYDIFTLVTWIFPHFNNLELKWSLVPLYLWLRLPASSKYDANWPISTFCALGMTLLLCVYIYCVSFHAGGPVKYIRYKSGTECWDTQI